MTPWLKNRGLYDRIHPHFSLWTVPILRVILMPMQKKTVFRGGRSKQCLTPINGSKTRRLARRPGTVVKVHFRFASAALTPFLPCCGRLSRLGRHFLYHTS